MEITNKTALKIGLVCALCAFIGAMFALKFMDHHFWWIGVLAGGLLGYLSYELPKVIKAGPEAWKKATEFKIDRIVIKYFFINIAVILILISNVYFIVTPFRILNVTPGVLANIGWAYCFLVALWSAIAAAAFTFALCTKYPSAIASHWEYFSHKYDKPLLLGFFRYSSVFIALFAGLYFLSKFIYKNRDKIRPFFKKVLKAIRIFFWEFILLIHSEARLICGVDSCLGAAIGYYFASPMIGAIAGAVLGVVNYYVVSIKILKLQPKI